VHAGSEPRNSIQHSARRERTEDTHQHDGGVVGLVCCFDQLRQHLGFLSLSCQLGFCVCCGVVSHHLHVVVVVVAAGCGCFLCAGGQQNNSSKYHATETDTVQLNAQSVGTGDSTQRTCMRARLGSGSEVSFSASASSWLLCLTECVLSVTCSVEQRATVINNDRTQCPRCKEGVQLTGLVLVVVMVTFCPCGTCTLGTATAAVSTATHQKALRAHSTAIT
jgi:hypothetical protein